MNNSDLSPQLQQQVREAAAAHRPLCLRGGGCKDFYGGALAGDPLELSGHRGIVNYQPTELVLTARSGTPLREIERVLASSGQYLSFEPPGFGAEATLGGCVASGLSGPRRPWGGSARDVILGCRLINGRGELLRFGGEVMKNVAGFDVSRLVTGALGTLGIITEVSLKVLPRPHTEITRFRAMDQAEAIAEFARWRSRPWPLSAAAWLDGVAWWRLSGSEAAVQAAGKALGGSPADNEFWDQLNEQQLPFFARRGEPLWRLSLPPATAPLAVEGATLVDWGGAQRWLRSGEPPERLRAAATAAGGHATLFRGDQRSAGVFHPLDPVRMALQRRVKSAFDPAGIFNPGRLHPDL